MKLARHLIVVHLMKAVSVSICIPTSSHPWIRGKSLYRRDTISIPSVQSSGEWSPDAKGTALWKEKMLVKRTEGSETPDVPDAPLDDARKPGNGAPTHSEAKEVLSAKEFKRYLQLWEEAKAYNRAYYAARKAKREGRKQTAKEIEELEALKRKVAMLRSLRNEIQDRLVDSGKARRETIAQVERRRRPSDETRARRLKHQKAHLERKKEKIKALEDRIGTPQATEQDWKDWEEVQAERKYRIESETYRRKKLKEDPDAKRLLLANNRKHVRAYRQREKEKLKALEARVRTNHATEQDRKDWEAVLADRKVKAERTSEWRNRKASERTTKETEGGNTGAPSDDGSNASSDQSSNEFQSKGVRADHLNRQQLRSNGNALLNGPRHLIEDLRDKWQAIPWNKIVQPVRQPSSLGGSHLSHSPAPLWRGTLVVP